MPKRIAVDTVEPDVQVTPEVVTTQPKKIENLNSVDFQLKQKSGGPLAAFCAFPDGVKFDGEDPDEKVILVLRAHPMTNFPWLLISALACFVPGVILPLFFKINALPQMPVGFSFVLTIFWYLGVFTYGFLNFISWFFNVGIVTDERVVDIDWKSLTHRETTMSLISKVQDITPKQGGVLASIFDYGSVFVQTAGTEPNIEFINIPHAQLVARKLHDLISGEEKEWETK